MSQVILEIITNSVPVSFSLAARFRLLAHKLDMMIEVFICHVSGSQRNLRNILLLPIHTLSHSVFQIVSYSKLHKSTLKGLLKYVAYHKI